MTVHFVNDRASSREFIEFPKTLYKDDPNWVCPPDSEVEGLFHASANPLLKRGGDAARWILKDSSGELMGRISAFFKNKREDQDGIFSAGIGHFECIDSQEAANLLFSTASNWLAERGFQAVDGPINFGENNTNWGLLVEGFSPPSYGMNYHKRYYKKLFEDFGFQLYFKQFSYRLDMTKDFPERFWKIAEWVCSKPGYSFKHFRWSESENFVRDMVEIYNMAWADFKEDFDPARPEDIRAALQKARPIIDEEMIWFAYYEGAPIAFYIMFPDVNQILRHLGGKTDWWAKIKFMYYKWRGEISRTRALAAGVIPKFQNSGVESGIFWQLKGVMERKPHYKEVELSWVGDFNPKMISLYKAVGGEHVKTHHTYRYMIDKSIPFKRFMPDALDSKVVSK